MDSKPDNPKCGDWYKLIEAESLRRDVSDAEGLEQGDFFRFLGFSPLGLYECYCPKKGGRFWISGKYLIKINDKALIKKLEESVPSKYLKPLPSDGNKEARKNDEKASQTALEIVHKLIGLLNGHISGIRGYMGQSPYQDDLFALFQQAYENNCHLDTCSPRLTADALMDYLNKNWAYEENEESEKGQLLRELYERWHHWSFAWRKLKG